MKFYGRDAEIKKLDKEIKAPGLGCRKYVFGTRSRTRLKASETVEFIPMKELYQL